jgi:hypothetical protein
VKEEFVNRQKRLKEAQKAHAVQKQIERLQHPTESSRRAVKKCGYLEFSEVEEIKETQENKLDACAIKCATGKNT